MRKSSREILNLDPFFRAWGSARGASVAREGVDLIKGDLLRPGVHVGLELGANEGVCWAVG